MLQSRQHRSIHRKGTRYVSYRSFEVLCDKKTTYLVLNYCFLFFLTG